MSEIIKEFGWIKDKEDKRDLKFEPFKLEPIESVYINHTHRFPLAYRQGALGSCTAQAIAFQVHVNLLNNRSLAKYSPFIPSRLFIYYYERELMGTINKDSGAFLRDGIKVVAKQGAPSEDLWNYDIRRFKEQPPQRAIDKGINFQALQYERIDQTQKILLVNALKMGLPICFGMYVFRSFVSDEVEATGIVPFPDLQKEDVLGGHAMCIVGYRQLDDTFIVRNSWGTEWGQKGYCRIPSSFITNPYLTDDFWVISEIE